MTLGPKPYVFVLMPFSDEFKDVYELGIKAACDELGFYCERVDETHVLGPVYDKVVNSIAKADIIVTDLTGKNTNVYYETGYAHALKKVSIHLCQNIDEIPFDLRGFQHIVYSGRIFELKNRLKEKLDWAESYLRTKGMEIGPLSFEFFHNGKEIDKHLESVLAVSFRPDGSISQLTAAITLDITNSGNSEGQQLGPVYLYTGPEVINVLDRFGDPNSGGPSFSENEDFVYRHHIDFSEILSASEWRRLRIPLILDSGIEIIDGLEIPIRIRFLTESTPLDMDLGIRLNPSSEAPTVKILVTGLENPQKIECTAERVFSRNGAVEEAGFSFPLALINTASRRKQVSSLHIYTKDYIVKADSGRMVLGLGDGTYLPSDEEGYDKKFMEDIVYGSSLDPYEYKADTLSLELDPRRANHIIGTEIPVRIKLFTEDGVVDQEFTIELT